MKLKHIIASLAFAAANLAHAAPITLFTWGQIGTPPTVAAVNTGLSTTIDTTAPWTPILITGIAPNSIPFFDPLPAFLKLHATSSSGTSTTLGTTFNQLFDGDFQINDTFDGSGSTFWTPFSPIPSSAVFSVVPRWRW